MGLTSPSDTSILKASNVSVRATPSTAPPTSILKKGRRHVEHNVEADTADGTCKQLRFDLPETENSGATLDATLDMEDSERVNDTTLPVADRPTMSSPFPKESAPLSLSPKESPLTVKRATPVGEENNYINAVETHEVNLETFFLSHLLQYDLKPDERPDSRISLDEEQETSGKTTQQPPLPTVKVDNEQYELSERTVEERRSPTHSYIRTFTREIRMTPSKSHRLRLPLQNRYF